MNEIDNEYNYLWESENKNYVLVKDNIYFGYFIFNIKFGTMLILEDNLIVPYIIDKMLANNVMVVENIEQAQALMPKTKPGPMWTVKKNG